MINVRKEFSKIIEKDSEYHHVIVRHLSDTKCSCWCQPPMIDSANGTTKVPNKAFRTVPDPECTNCGGSGYIYEEFLYKSMLFYPGFRFAHYDDATFALTEENVLTVYIKATQESLDNTRVNDWIFFLKENVNGSIVKPLLRTKKWIVVDVQQLRLDKNKLEYIKLYAKPVIL